MSGEHEIDKRFPYFEEHNFSGFLLIIQFNKACFENLITMKLLRLRFQQRTWMQMEFISPCMPESGRIFIENFGRTKRTRQDSLREDYESLPIESQDQTSLREERKL
jgi:hypothetical protein